jgi:hypothetical protein
MYASPGSRHVTSIALRPSLIQAWWIGVATAEPSANPSTYR